MERFPNAMTPPEAAQRLREVADARGSVAFFLSEIYEHPERVELLATVGLATRLIDDTPPELDPQGDSGAFNAGSLIGLQLASLTLPESALDVLDDTAAAKLVCSNVANYYGDDKSDLHSEMQSVDIGNKLVTLSGRAFYEAPPEYKHLVREWSKDLVLRAGSRPFVELGFGFVWSMIAEASKTVFNYEIGDEDVVDALHEEVSRYLTDLD